MSKKLKLAELLADQLLHSGDQTLLLSPMVQFVILLVA